MASDRPLRYKQGPIRHDDDGASVITLPQIYLIRHGETAWSLSGQHTGTTEVDLTENGQEQALRLMSRLEKVEFSHVLVSPRARAQQTCDLAGLSSASQTEPKLAEWNYGEFEGKRSVDIRKDRPNWSIWDNGCPGGESPLQMSNRVDRLIAHLLTMHDKVALFAHGHLGAALAARWLGLPISAGRHFVLHPASVSILGHVDNHPAKRVIELWNETVA